MYMLRRLAWKNFIISEQMTLSYCVHFFLLRAFLEIGLEVEGGGIGGMATKAWVWRRLQQVGK
jgi:hypothetical protein